MTDEHAKRSTAETPEEASKVGEVNKSQNEKGGEQRRTKFNEPEDPQAQRSR
ncbi:hypothetical protein GCM10009425_13360 [Pseudomonas asuensis]|jgi:hypothetical protein|uniref:Uncharacterized protein n=1 Tax=Pseudomonas asuensis TaxID=1825787 RepID=A0ABQ2GN11_9PSED|nr:hypothetical protein [Pseudomonas asuensis]GGM03396.1 hypothetical protein GCM10009425_13360 [Pseudomonas asuensis]